ncbi:MAG: nicotinamide riboside transporter PnuC [Gemmatimonadaceae bacterium]
MELCAWLKAHGTSCAEAAGFIFGVINVYLTVHEKIWSWPIGIVNAALSAVVFKENGLYSDFGLQFVYIAMSVYGWQQWLRGGEQKSQLHVTHTTARTAGVLAVLGLIGWVALYSVTSRIPGTKLPIVDASLVSSSLVAQWMMTRKKRESWMLWIVINIAYVATFIYRGLNLYAVLNTVYGILAVLGHIEWTRSFARTSRASS